MERLVGVGVGMNRKAGPEAHDLKVLSYFYQTFYSIYPRTGMRKHCMVFLKTRTVIDTVCVLVLVQYEYRSQSWMAMQGWVRQGFSVGKASVVPAPACPWPLSQRLKKKHDGALVVMSFLFFFYLRWQLGSICASDDGVEAQ